MQQDRERGQRLAARLHESHSLATATKHQSIDAASGRERIAATGPQDLD